VQKSSILTVCKKSSILTEGQGRAALPHAVLLVPGRKPGRTWAKIVHFNPWGHGLAALLSARSARKPGRSCAKIIPFNQGPRTDCDPSARSAPGS
jgi:hypothetical protein